MNIKHAVQAVVAAVVIVGITMALGQISAVLATGGFLLVSAVLAMNNFAVGKLTGETVGVEFLTAGATAAMRKVALVAPFTEEGLRVAAFFMEPTLALAYTVCLCVVEFNIYTAAADQANPSWRVSAKARFRSIAGTVVMRTLVVPAIHFGALGMLYAFGPLGVVASVALHYAWNYYIGSDDVTARMSAWVNA